MMNRRITLILLLVALLVVVPVYAQGEAATAEPVAVTDELPTVTVIEADAETATGLTVLVLLLGIGALGAVGGISILRERHHFQNE